MRKVMVMLVAAAAILFAGALAWKAEAASWGGGNLAATAKNFTPIIKTACGGPGANCRAGRHWVCGPAGRCWCAPC